MPACQPTLPLPLRSFFLDGKWTHDLSLDQFAEGVVYSNGGGTDVNFDCHRAGEALHCCLEALNRSAVGSWRAARLAHLCLLRLLLSTPQAHITTCSPTSTSARARACSTAAAKRAGAPTAVRPAACCRCRCRCRCMSLCLLVSLSAKLTCMPPLQTQTCRRQQHVVEHLPQQARRAHRAARLRLRPAPQLCRALWQGRLGRRCPRG